jgi:hypothetical protein
MTSAFLAESCQGDRTQGQQSVVKTAKSTVEVHFVWHDICYRDRQAEAGCCVLLRAPAQERPRNSEEPMPRCTNITTIFPRISKTAMRKPVNEEALFYLGFWRTIIRRTNSRHELRLTRPTLPFVTAPPVTDIIF